MTDFYQLVKDTLEGAERAVKMGEEMYTDELRKVASLTTSSEWTSWPEEQQLQALAEQIDKVNNAKNNLQLAKKARNRLKKRAKEIGL